MIIKYLRRLREKKFRLRKQRIDGQGRKLVELEGFSELLKHHENPHLELVTSARHLREEEKDSTDSRDFTPLWILLATLGLAGGLVGCGSDPEPQPQYQPSRSESVDPVVRQALENANSADPSFRVEAARILGQNGGNRSDVVEALIKLSSDPVRDVRKEAVSSLGLKTYEERIQDQLIATASGDVDSEVVATAIRALTARPLGQENVQDSNSAKVQHAKTFPAIRSMVNHPSQEIRTAVADSLVEMLSTSRMPLAKEMLKRMLKSDPSPAVRLAAMRAYQRTPYDGTTSEMVFAAADAPDATDEMKLLALQILGEKCAGEADILWQIRMIGTGSDEVEAAAVQAMESVVNADPTQVDVVLIDLDPYANGGEKTRRQVKRTIEVINGFPLTGAQQMQLEDIRQKLL